MIFEWLMSLGTDIVTSLMMLLDFLPSFPSSVSTIIDSIFTIMFDGIGLVSIFVDMSMVKILIPIVIAVLNLDKIIKFIIFVIKKIPLLGME